MLLENVNLETLKLFFHRKFILVIKHVHSCLVCVSNFIHFLFKAFKAKKTVEAKNARSDKKNDHVQIFIIIIQNFGKKEVFSVDHSNFYVGQVFKLV